ncbi:MAG: glycine cleavage system protein H [Candidatus Heimdallarchaeota archaeon]|nr:glycine cleavage system protein H [Candidatus Heimdallarchaeota archaeon]
MITIDEYEFDETLYYFTGGDGHIWLKKLEDGNVLVGFDDFGQKLAGKILFVRTIPAGKTRPKGKSLGTIETGKYVGALRCPVTGTIVEINPKLKENPSIINEDPYNKGWIAKIKPDNLEEELKTDFVYGEEALREWIAKEIAEHKK